MYEFALKLSCIRSDGGGNCSPWGRQTYWASLTSMDAAIGLMRQGLRDLGAFDNTVFLFMSDNGPDRHRLGSTQAFGETLSGIKFETREGGIRVPAVLEWPKFTASIPEERRLVTAPVSSMDIFPTLLAITGTPHPAGLPILDGEDISSLLLGDDRPAHRVADAAVGVNGTTFLRTGGIPIKFRNYYGWIDRSGRYKWGQHYKTGVAETLVDLWADPAELHDISGSHRDVATRLKLAYRAWETQLKTELQ